MKLPVEYDAMSSARRALVRKEYEKLQNGYCWHCKADLKNAPAPEVLKRNINLKLFPPGFLTHPTHLHHDHSTGLTIGAVHARCNAVLWQYHGK